MLPLGPVNDAGICPIQTKLVHLRHYFEWCWTEMIDAKIQTLMCSMLMPGNGKDEMYGSNRTGRGGGGGGLSIKAPLFYNFAILLNSFCSLFLFPPAPTLPFIFQQLPYRYSPTKTKMG
jgi:hypothetical protein